MQMFNVLSKAEKSQIR